MIVKISSIIPESKSNGKKPLSKEAKARSQESDKGKS
jgi:hypothetical protein